MKDWSEGKFRLILELVGAAAVLLGLIFVGLEIRQNTEAVRSSTIQEITRWSYDGNILMIEQPELREAWRNSCSDELTPDQGDLLFNLYSGVLRVQLNRYHQSRLGILDQDLALSLGGRSVFYQHPMFAEVWAQVRDGFDADFQEFVVAELLPMIKDNCPVPARNL
jgi:hypothetical protein